MRATIGGEPLPETITFDLGDDRLSLRGEMTGEVVRFLSRLGDGEPRAFRVEGEGVSIQTTARLALRISSSPRGGHVEAHGPAEPITIEEVAP